MPAFLEDPLVKQVVSGCILEGIPVSSCPKIWVPEVNISKGSRGFMPNSHLEHHVEDVPCTDQPRAPLFSEILLPCRGLRAAAQSWIHGSWLDPGIAGGGLPQRPALC